MGITLGIIGVVGLGTQVAGQIMAANANADAQRKSAEIKGQQADELMSREAINENILNTQESRAESDYVSSFASSGREGGGLGGVLRMRSDLAITQANNLRDASFKAQMLRQGAEIDQTLASDAQTAGYVGAFGTIFKGATDVYGLYKKNSTPSPLYSTDSTSGGSSTTVFGTGKLGTPPTMAAGVS